MSDISPTRDRFRWTILALISVSHVIGASAQYGINTLAPFYKDDLGLSRAQVGLFFSSFYLAMTGASFGTGWLADRLGVRQTTMQGHLILGVCTAMAALSTSFEFGCVSFFLAGFGYSFLNPASTIGVMTWFHRDERATAMGAKQTGVPCGGVLAAVLAPTLVLLIGWRGALAALGGINFISSFLFFRLWREPRAEIQEAPTAEERSADQGALNVGALWPISCATAIYLIGQMALITYVPLYLKDALGYSPYWASQALALTQAGAMVGRVGWGVISDRIFGGRRKIVLILIGAVSVVWFIALSFMDRNSSTFLLMSILFLAGVSIVGYQGVSYALIGEISGKAKTGTGLGMMIAINAGAATLGTPIFGYIVDRTGSYAIAWQVLAVAVATGMIAMAIMLKEPRRTAAQPFHKD
ncbi:MAG: MFS transporter [Deltaproteobacteria bacterium]|nr:MFS transporter [Deltaproteobacteria bacterium]